MQNSGEHKRTYMDCNWIGSHARVVAVGALLVAIGLGIIGPMVANTEEPNFDPGGEIFTAVDLPSLFVDLGTEHTTAIPIQGGRLDAEIKTPGEDTVDGTAAQLAAETHGVTARVTGEILAQFHGMDLFTRSMLVSLPLALALALIIASVMLRSTRYALASALPIGPVVVGIYALMATFGALTAVMIRISLMVALLVLPSLLVLVTPSQVRHDDIDPVAAKEALRV
jgi:hypothetical protein